MIKTKNGNVIQFITNVEDISTLKGDVVINWITTTLSSADNSYYQLHKKAGGQLHDASLIFRNKISESDSFTTIGALLDFNLCVHTVLPKKRMTDYNLMWRNTLQNIKRYKSEDNLCKDIYCVLPDVDVILFFRSFNLYDTIFEKVNFHFLTSDKDLEEKIQIEIYDSKFTKLLKSIFKKKVNGRNKQKEL